MRWLLAAMVVAVVLRAGVAAFAFPLFSNIDEQAHADTLHKYARGQLPETGQDRYDPEILDTFFLYQSPDWLIRPEPGQPNLIPAQFPHRDQHEAEYLAKQREDWNDRPNHEAFQPPTYFVVGTAWWHLGRALGFDTVRNLFWSRLVSVLFLAWAVIAGYRLAKLVCPQRPFLWLGVPALVAVFPQDIFFFINTDAPPALLFPLGVELTLRLIAGDPRRWLQVLAGLTWTACILTKPTTAPLVVPAGLLCAVLLIRRWREARVRSLVPFVLGAGVPAVAWFAYVLIATGELMGGHHKIELLRFSPQTWDGFTSHPIFTLDGLREYFGTLLPSFWRGDTFWYGELLHHVAMDRVYLITTVVFLGAAALGARLPGTAALPRLLRWTLWLGLGAGLGLLLTLSLAWQFPDFGYPSKEFPYYANGRLLLGLLVPFAILYLDGLERLSRALRRPNLAWLVLGALILAIAVSEAVQLWPVLTCPHNLFQLRV